MNVSFHLWLGAALYVLGARIMDGPGEEKDGPVALSKIAWVEDFASTLLLFLFTLSMGYVWYETSYVWAVVYVTAALPGTVVHDALASVARRWRASGTTIAIACRSLGPAIAGFGAYLMAGDLMRLAHPSASWRLW